MLSGFSSHVKSEHPVWIEELTDDPEMEEPVRSAGFKGNKGKWSCRMLLYVLHCADKTQWWIICHVSVWLDVFVVSNVLNRNHSRIYPPCPWPPSNQIPWGDCAQCPEGQSSVATEPPLPWSRGEAWGTGDGSSQNRDWVGWGGSLDQSQGTLTQKCCLQLKPQFQRVQVLGLPKGALECKTAALSGDRG